MFHAIWHLGVLLRGRHARKERKREGGEKRKGKAGRGGAPALRWYGAPEWLIRLWQRFSYVKTFSITTICGTIIFQSMSYYP